MAGRGPSPASDCIGVWTALSSIAPKQRRQGSSLHRSTLRRLHRSKRFAEKGVKVGNCSQIHGKTEPVAFLIEDDEYREILAHQDLSARHAERQHEVALHRLREGLFGTRRAEGLLIGH
jgi:hypothetical protein